MIKIKVKIIIIKKQGKNKIIKKMVSVISDNPQEFIPKETASSAFNHFTYRASICHKIFTVVSDMLMVNLAGDNSVFSIICWRFPEVSLRLPFVHFLPIFPRLLLCLKRLILPVPVSVTERRMLHNHNFKVSQCS